MAAKWLFLSVSYRARPGKRGIVPPFPPILEQLVDHLMNNKLLPADTRPDSCIINQYDKGDCIPPHVDHPSYYRPISTLSLLGEEPMLVGSKFKTVRSCTWVPTVGKAIPLPRRSLLILGGNSGNIAKHCVSSCQDKRISITLRKQPDPDWSPDESELVGKKRGNSEQSKSGSSDINGEIAERSKKKALSGSAKRRKKMMKQRGLTRHATETRNTDASIKADINSAVVTSVKKKHKSSEKRARRNAKKLLKRQDIKKTEQAKSVPA